MFVFIFAVLAVGFICALLPTDVSTDRLYLGLPSGAAIILYIVGLLPMVVLPLAYALTFEQTTLADEELERLRAQLAELRTQAAPDAVQLPR